MSPQEKFIIESILADAGLESLNAVVDNADSKTKLANQTSQK